MTQPDGDRPTFRFDAIRISIHGRGDPRGDDKTSGDLVASAPEPVTACELHARLVLHGCPSERERLLGYLAILSWLWPGGMHFQGAFRRLGLRWAFWGFLYSAIGLWAVSQGWLAYGGLLGVSWGHFLLMLGAWKRSQRERREVEG